MKPRVFIDTNVFIFGFERKKSISRKVINLLNDGQIDAVISERIIKELLKYFKKFYNRKLANDFRNYVIQSCEVVFAEELEDEIKHYKGKIKDKDLEQISAVKYMGLKYLISLDRDFIGFDEYTTPKEFIKIMGLKSHKTEY